MRRYAPLAFVALLALPSVIRAQAQAEPATLEVVNDQERPMLIWIEGEPREVVDAYDRIVIGGVPPGTVSLLASEEGIRDVVASERRHVEPGERFTWTIHPAAVFDETRGAGMLVITNELDQTVDVILAGDVLARLAPESRRTLQRVPAGDATLIARDRRGNRVYEREIVVVPGEITRWAIGSSD